MAPLLRNHWHGHSEIATCQENRDAFEASTCRDEENLKSAEYNVEAYSEKDSLLDLVLGGKLTYQDYKEHRALRSLVIGYFWLDFSQDAFNNLMLQRDHIPVKYDAVIQEVSGLYNISMPRVKENYKDVGNMVKKISNDWQFTQPWYMDIDSSYLEQEINYFLTDPFFINHAGQYKMLAIGNLLHTVVNMRLRGIWTYQSIHAVLGMETEMPPNISRVKRLASKAMKPYLGEYSMGKEVKRLKIRVDF